MYEVEAAEYQPQPELLETIDMLSPGEQPRSKPVNPLRITLAVLACLVVAAGLFSQKRYIKEYQLYFTEERQAASFEFSELSESWTEATLQDKFTGFRMSCDPYQGNLAADRVCAVDVKSHNGVPALFMSFFFVGGHLDQVSVNVPWWSHGTAQKSLVAALGQPSASQLLPRDGVRLQGWRLANGAALFFNRDYPLNPFFWNAVSWRSAPSCARGACFKDKATS